jgi:hypothetical protein
MISYTHCSDAVELAASELMRAGRFVEDFSVGLLEAAVAERFRSCPRCHVDCEHGDLDGRAGGNARSFFSTLSFLHN